MTRTMNAEAIRLLVDALVDAARAHGQALTRASWAERSDALDTLVAARSAVLAATVMHQGDAS